MEQELAWWTNDLYWIRGERERNESDVAKVKEIVAEATRRGEAKAWEEAMQIIGDSKLFPTCCESRDCHMIDFEACIRAKIADKLSSLTNKKEV